VIASVCYWATSPVHSSSMQLCPTCHMVCLCVGHTSRDVNETRESRVSIFFLDPKKGISRLLRIETSDHPTIGPIVSGIIVTCRPARTCYQLIACLLHSGRGPHTRCTNAAKQRTLAYLSGREQRQ